MNAPLTLRAALVLACLLPWTPADPAWTRSAFAPRHSGTEMPGSVPRVSSMPMGGAVHRPLDGTRGRQDAYGRPIVREEPREPAPRRRLPPGAGGGYGRKGADDGAERPLPDPNPSKPAWNF